MAKDIDKTKVVNKGMPTEWKCPHCGRRNHTSIHADDILLRYMKYIEHCENCGNLHLWELELTEDFKKKVVEMLVKGEI